MIFDFGNKRRKKFILTNQYILQIISFHVSMYIQITGAKTIRQVFNHAILPMHQTQKFGYIPGSEADESLVSLASPDLAG